MGELAWSDVEPDVGANYHVARATASDEAWGRVPSGRKVALAQGTAVSRYLGRLVETELERRRTRPERRVSGEAGLGAGNTARCSAEPTPVSEAVAIDSGVTQVERDQKRGTPAVGIAALQAEGLARLLLAEG
jgi:hypothetical protein